MEKVDFSRSPLCLYKKLHSFVSTNDAISMVDVFMDDYNFDRYDKKISTKEGE